MITGTDAAKALSGLIDAGDPYDPDAPTCEGPETMRALLEGEWDMRGWFDSAASNLPGRIKLTTPRSKLTCLDAGICDITAAIRPAPPIQSNDYRGYSPLLKAFWAYLTASGRQMDVPIEHRLDTRPWPLRELFVKELRKRTRYELGDCFDQAAYYRPDEPQLWDEAHVPLYNFGYDDDDVVLLEFCQEICSQLRDSSGDMGLPQVAYEVTSEGECHAANRALFWLLKNRRERLLTKSWRLAIRALADYEYGIIGFHDYGECRIEIDSAESIEYLFCSADAVRRLRTGLWPLLKELGKNQKFWEDFVEKLNAIAKRHKKEIAA